MIAVDTNVLVRFLVVDEETPGHSAIAGAEFARAREALVPIFLPIVTVIETVWVLNRHPNVPKKEVLLMLDAVLEDPLVQVDRRAPVGRARDRWRAGSAGFAD